MTYEPVAEFEGRSEASKPCSSGVSVLDSHRALVEIVGAEAIERALGRVSPPIATAYRELLAVSWIPISDVEAVYRAIAEEAGMPIDELQVATVRRGIEHTVRGAWKMLLRITTDEALVKRAPLIYSRAFNVGTLEARAIHDDHALLELEGFPTISDFSLLGLSAGIEGVLRSAGRKEATVTFERTTSGARLEARWRRR